jgi:hypothetical protein
VNPQHPAIISRRPGIVVGDQCNGGGHDEGNICDLKVQLETISISKQSPDH